MCRLERVKTSRGEGGGRVSSSLNFKIKKPGNVMGQKTVFRCFSAKIKNLVLFFQAREKAKREKKFNLD